MGKRSDFARRPMDAYQTPYAAVPALIPYLRGITYFAEPCAGEGKLVRHLESFGLRCEYEADIQLGYDALKATRFGIIDAIITNPPWTRTILHPMIKHFQSIAPTWLLFDADWPHTKQAIPYLDQCSHIVAVGRLKWVEDSNTTGKDNACWYRFHSQHVGGPRFYPQMAEAA